MVFNGVDVPWGRDHPAGESFTWLGKDELQRTPCAFILHTPNTENQGVRWRRVGSLKSFPRGVHEKIPRVGERCYFALH